MCMSTGVTFHTGSMYPLSPPKAGLMQGGMAGLWVWPPPCWPYCSWSARGECGPDLSLQEHTLGSAVNWKTIEANVYRVEEYYAPSYLPPGGPCVNTLTSGKVCNFVMPYYTRLTALLRMHYQPRHWLHWNYLYWFHLLYKVYILQLSKLSNSGSLHCLVLKNHL